MLYNHTSITMAALVVNVAYMPLGSLFDDPESGH